MSLAIEPDVSSSLLGRSRGQQVAGRIANMTGIALVPDALWREAERRAAVIRPLAARLADLVCDRPLTSTSKTDT